MTHVFLLGSIIFSSLAGVIHAGWVVSSSKNIPRMSSWSSSRCSRDHPCHDGVVTPSSVCLGGSPTSQNEKTMSTSTTTSTTIPLWTEDEIDTFAKERGMIVTFSTLGPGYRAVARAIHDESIILGYVEGFVRPTGQILHLDKMQIFQPVVNRMKENYPETLNFQGVSFGIGLLMGYKCLLFGKDKGCRIAEFLAIDDMEFQHKRLVRYYKRVGFKVVKYVGEDIRDIPDRLIWGGCGTLMKEDVSTLMEKWSKTMTLMQSRRRTEQLE